MGAPRSSLLMAAFFAVFFIPSGVQARSLAQAGICQSPGDPYYAGDWARKGVTVTLTKLGDRTNCSRVLTLTMADEPRFHSNPYIRELAMFVQVPSSGGTYVPYVMGQRVYTVPLFIAPLPCNAFSACQDYIGTTCEQQGIAVIFEQHSNDGCPGSNELVGIRDGETYDPITYNFTPDPSLPCMVGNSASYGDVDQGIYDAVAYQTPDAFSPGRCVWNVNLTLTPDQRYRFSDYLDFISFRALPPTNYGAYPRLFFKGQETYFARFGNTDCSDTFLNLEFLYIEEFLGQYPSFQTGKSLCPFQAYKLYSLMKGVRYSFYTGPPFNGTTPPPVPVPSASPAPAAPAASPSPAPVAPATPSPSPAPVAQPAPSPAGSGMCPNQPDNSTLVARINCGGPALQYPAGCAWTADSSTSPYPSRTGGIATNTPGACNPATNPGGPIACSDRWGGFLVYTFPATAGATYQVVIHMAETYWTTSGNRRVRSYINGQLMTPIGIDPLTAGGGRFLPTLLSYTTTATPAGSILISFDATSDQPSVVGIEVYQLGSASSPATPSPTPATPSPSPAPATPSPTPATPSPAPATPSPAPATPSPEPATPSPTPATPSPTPATVAQSPAPATSTGGSVCLNQPANSVLVARVNCGGPALQYPAGCAWTADSSTSPYPNRTGGIATNTPGACNPATNPGGPIACSDRWGGFLNYTFPATSGATYQVVVRMAETYWTAAGFRRVRIYINNVPQMETGIDPFTAAGLPGGRFSPALFTYTAQGTADGSIVVGFDATADQPSVVGIEVYGISA